MKNSILNCLNLSYKIKETYGKEVPNISHGGYGTTRPIW
jgi:hypothetical protein